MRKKSPKTGNKGDDLLEFMRQNTPALEGRLSFRQGMVPDEDQEVIFDEEDDEDMIGQFNVPFEKEVTDQFCARVAQ